MLSLRKSAVVFLFTLPLLCIGAAPPEPLDHENFVVGQIGKFRPASDKEYFATASAEPAPDEVIVVGFYLDGEIFRVRGDAFILKGVDRSKIKLEKKILLNDVYKVLRTKNYVGRSFWVIRAATPAEKAAFEKKSSK